MSLIETVAPDSASGEVAALYEQMRAAFGGVPGALSVWSASPLLLRQQFEFIGYYMQHPRLSGALLATMRMLVSMDTKCAYCIEFNAGMLINMLGWTPDQVAAARADPGQANLPEREKALLLWVLKSVRDANSVTPGELDALRGLGWSDQDILDALGHGARMVAADIVLNAFKVARDF